MNNGEEYWKEYWWLCTPPDIWRMLLRMWFPLECSKMNNTATPKEALEYRRLRNKAKGEAK